MRLPAEEAIVPADLIRILEADRSNFVFHLGPETSNPNATAEDVFQLDQTGKLTVSGETWGYIRTAKHYRDYHLVLEYRFTGSTSGKRKLKARDSGLLLHCFGEDGSRRRNWIPSIEVQIMEGATGDFIVLGPFDDSGNLLPVHLESTVEFRSKKAKVPYYSPDRESRVMPKDETGANAVFHVMRNRNYREVRDWHHQDDADYSTESQQWNRLDVIANNDKIDVYVNGHLVNRGWSASLPKVGWEFSLREPRLSIVTGFYIHSARLIYRSPSFHRN
ncbi:family 16 glycoside hydrolase [Bremerella sp.]|uniref:family 16 glycoside hydrolase n=1 Tax=Bremerella sp. TaxID=2795602 RepID=UPI00391B1C1E